MGKCEESLKLVEKHLKVLQDFKEKVDKKRMDLFNENHEIRKHAQNEHEHWCKTIQEIDHLLEVANRHLNKLIFAKTYISRKFPGTTLISSCIKSEKKRRKKENTRKSRKRKANRLVSRAAKSLKRLCSDEVAVLFVTQMEKGEVNAFNENSTDVKNVEKLKKRYDEEPFRFLVEKGAFPEGAIKHSVEEQLKSWSNSLTTNNTENEKGKGNNDQELLSEDEEETEDEIDDRHDIEDKVGVLQSAD